MASSAPPMQTQTLSADLMACLGQEDMTDLHLLGTDGVKVPAFRTILACRSDVFRKMLVGNFKESTSDTVELGYSSEALRAVVEFCITDNITQFDGRCDESAARGIVQLVACAHFLNMPLVEEKARTMAKTLVKEHKSCACAIFDEATLVGKPAESVKLDALNTMRNIDGVSLCLSANVISCLKPEALGELISDDGMHCEEIDMFRALNEWATAEVEDSSLKLVPEEGRADIAKQLAAAYICLPSIKPSDLVGIVRESGLVDERMISEALEAQALFAESETDLTFSKKRKRKGPGFDVSGAGTDVVNGFYKKDGEHDGYPKFTKTCTWKGENRTLGIYKHSGLQWCIALVKTDGSIKSSGFEFYYGFGFEKPPSEVWKKSSLGSDPCPVCFES